MIAPVVMFAIVNVIFELVVLSMVNPYTRLRILGSDSACTALHVLCLALNLIIHWGTLIGTMSGISSFVCSIVAVHFARSLWGTIKDNRYYTVGWVKYSTKEIK